MREGYPRFLSEPVELEWLGWRSNTLMLQQCGWAISAGQQVERDEMSLALEHAKTQIRMLSYLSKDWGFRRNADPFGGWGHARQQGMQIEFAGRDMYVNPSLSLRDFSRFTPIDATPSMTMEPARRLEDLVHFQPIETKRIILPPDTVDDLMKKILNMQEPMREEYFRQQARDERGKVPTLHAQLYSLGSAA